MNLEEQDQICSNSSRFSKKQKLKKIPQRGLGVAQLERIRMEEQQKKAVGDAIFTYPPLVSLSPTNSSSLPVPFFNYPSSQSPPSVPLTSPSPTSISSSENPVIRPYPAVSYEERLYLNSSHVPSLNYPIGNGFEFGWKSVDESDHLHKMWNPYWLNHEKENSMSGQGLSICANLSLPFESSTILPLPDIMPRPPQFSQTSASSSMNVPLMNSRMIPNFQMEPPSNQNMYSNFSSVWQEGDKMNSAKRPCPFSLDISTLPTSHSKLPRIACTLDDSIPFECGSLFRSKHDIPILREAALMPSSSSFETTRKKNKKETENQHGDFLALAPPSITSSQPSPKSWHSLSHRNAEEPVYNATISGAENLRFTQNPALNSVPKAAGLNHKVAENKAGLNHPYQFFSFIPPSKAEESSATNKHTNSNGNGDARGTIDLNLKL